MAAGGMGIPGGAVCHLRAVSVRVSAPFFLAAAFSLKDAGVFAEQRVRFSGSLPAVARTAYATTLSARLLWEWGEHPIG